MRTLCVSIFAAVAALYAVAGVDCADVSVADFPRLEGETVRGLATDISLAPHEMRIITP